MKRLLAGQKSIAIDYLNKAVATGKPEDCEYLFAQQELRELGPSPTARQSLILVNFRRR